MNNKYMPVNAQKGHWGLVDDDLEKPARVAARQIEDRIANVQSDVLLLSAGGSSLKILKQLSADLMSERLTIGVLDERITNQVTDRNSYQLKQTKFGEVAVKDGRVGFLDILTDDPVDITAVANRFEQQLTDWHTNHPSGDVIATVGVGTDGHVAGMIPNKEDLFADRFIGNRYVSGYKPPRSSNFIGRVTTTVTWFRDQLDTAFVYAVGNDKCSVLKKLLQNELPIHKMPAQVLKSAPTHIFTDCNLT